MTRRWRRRVERGERGVALVEFALVFPVFMTLVLGMFSGGLAYNRKLTLTNAAREAARYAATLDLTGQPWDTDGIAATAHSLDAWLYQVADAVQRNAENDLDAGVPALSICVAYVHPNGPTHTTDPDAAGHTLLRTNSGSSYGASGPAAQCFSDGITDGDEKRVHVEVSRRSDLQLLFFDIAVTLSSESVMRFERG